MIPDADGALETFAGARPGEQLCVTPRGVCLLVDGHRRWAEPHEAIREVIAVRQVLDGVVHDTIRVSVNGRDRHFLVATSLVEDDYDAEFSEAVADAVAEALRRAVGLR